MPSPVLTIDELSNIEAGSWFSKLSPPLREAILSRAGVRRIADGALLSSRGVKVVSFADWQKIDAAEIERLDKDLTPVTLFPSGALQMAVYDKLPVNARLYLQRIKQVTGVPIDMISTSPDRDHTIMMRHPYLPD